MDEILLQMKHKVDALHAHDRYVLSVTSPVCNVLYVHQNCHCRSAFHLGKICLKPIKKESPLTKSGILLGLAFKKCRMGHCGNKIN